MINESGVTMATASDADGQMLFSKTMQAIHESRERLRRTIEIIDRSRASFRNCEQRPNTWDYGTHSPDPPFGPRVRSLGVKEEAIRGSRGEEF